MKKCHSKSFRVAKRFPKNTGKRYGKAQIFDMANLPPDFKFSLSAMSNDSCHVSIPPCSIMNVPSALLPNNFKFIFDGGKEVSCNKIIACMISPEVSRALNENPNVSNFRVCCRDLNNDMDLLLTIFRKGSADIPPNRMDDIIDLSLELGNANIALQLRRFKSRCKSPGTETERHAERSVQQSPLPGLITSVEYLRRILNEVP